MRSASRSPAPARSSGGGRPRPPAPPARSRPRPRRRAPARPGSSAATTVGVGVLLALCGCPWPLTVIVAGSLGGGVWWLARRRPSAGGLVLEGAARSAWGVLQRPGSPAELTRVEIEIAALRQVGGDGILAAGLLAAARGDLTQARLLLQSLDDAEPLATPRITQRATAEYLMADALERGDFATLTEVGRKTEQLSPLLRFLHLAGVRLRGLYFGCSQAELQKAWRGAPGAARLAPLYERARTAERVTFDDDFDRALEVPLPEPRSRPR